LINITFTFVDY